MNTEQTNVVTATKENKVAKVNKPTSVAEYLAETRKTNPNSGSIELDVMEKTLKLDRHTIVSQSRNAGKDTFLCVGRKGRSSTLLYGQAAKDFLANRNVNQKQKSNPRPRKTSQPETKVEGIHFPTLRLTVGGQTVDVPISAELIAA